MGVNFKLIFILTGLIFILSSCRTSAPRLDYQALARASILLGVDINMEDMDGLKAAMKIKNFEKNPANGGIPASENSEIVIRKAIFGFVL